MSHHDKRYRSEEISPGGSSEELRWSGGGNGEKGQGEAFREEQQLSSKICSHL